jgi:hypothetical protein
MQQRTGPFGGSFMGHDSAYSRPDNSSMVRRSVNGKNGGAGALGEYFNDVYYRTYMVRGSAGQGGVMGPLTAPTIQGPQPQDQISLLQNIRDLLLFMPQAMSDEWRTRFIVQPRESISFVTGSASVTVPGGTAVAVVSELIDERFTGFLTHVGMNVIAGGAFSDVIWQIRINGAIHPKFANKVFFSNTLASPYPFAFELCQARTLQLVAINTLAGPIQVAGVLAGWTEFMSTFKTYGSSPQSGIA